MPINTQNLARSAAMEPPTSGGSTLLPVHFADEFAGVTPPLPAVLAPAEIFLTVQGPAELALTVQGPAAITMVVE